MISIGHFSVKSQTPDFYIHHPKTNIIINHQTHVKNPTRSHKRIEN